ncbi:N-acetylmuramoyl-L-alanine amidase [Litchfieldia alkalitelluris]|uniref:N-acetylmuramoyl-L-alanine amidase n=1 Tax=Litchfieldia alkalitelluris TaxID=304268 RepID=UPI000996C2F9|nr:N-acetylmuramoyl-L-alanine amidase [Litchfieldia alkalitelluris]
MGRIRLLIIMLLLISFILPSKVISANELALTTTEVEEPSDVSPVVESEEIPPVIEEEKMSVNYSVFVQEDGWLDVVSNGQTAGTEGHGQQIEGLQVSLENAPYQGGISYQTFVNKVWLDLAADGETSGPVGESTLVEAIQLNLTGEMSTYYDVYYRVHAQNYGWLDWAKNGEPAGTDGFSKALGAVEIVLVEKDGQAPGPTDLSFLIKPSVSYTTHVQTYGWKPSVSDGAMSGTSGESKRLEAIKIELSNLYSGNITYSTHVQSYGWMDPVSNGELSGTSGQSKRLEAITVDLTGEISEYFDVYYRVHAQTFGWLGWAKNGETAGTEGLSRRLEAIEIVLVEKGGQAPISTKTAFIKKQSVSYTTHVQTFGWLDHVTNGAMSGTSGQSKRLEAIKINLPDTSISGGISYSTHVQSFGWLNPVSNGELSGTSGQSKRLEAIKINLTGEIAQYYDVYYRVHAQTFGWLGWAKNGMNAGTAGLSKRLEAIEIKLVPKGLGISVSENDAYKVQEPILVFLDPGHGGRDPGATVGGYREADLNLKVAKKVQTLLQNQGIRVKMSRQGDTYVELLNRSIMANEAGADIFISIHHNSSGYGTTMIQGIETYYYEVEKDYPSKINADMHDDPERISKSITLSNFIHENMVSYTGATDRGVEGESYSVTREVKMPATLLELGYLNNSSELKKITTDSYQNQLAKAIADGIIEYIKTY